MKIKTDFITNSSSSSFVVAIKKGTTYEDIENSIRDEFNSYFDEMDEWEKERIQEEYETIDKEQILKLFAQELFSHTQHALELGDWMVSSREYGNEDGGFGDFIYSYLHLDSDIIKLKGYY